jgi:hypothetical protein
MGCGDCRGDTCRHIVAIQDFEAHHCWDFGRASSWVKPFWGLETVLQGRVYELQKCGFLILTVRIRRLLLLDLMLSDKVGWGDRREEGWMTSQYLPGQLRAWSFLEGARAPRLQHAAAQHE